MRARIFHYLSPDSYKFERELDLADADEAWRQLQSLGEGAALKKGPIVYIGDLYFELDGDGGWRPLPPGSERDRTSALSAVGSTARARFGRLPTCDGLVANRQGWSRR